MAGYNLEYYKLDNLSGYRQNYDFPLHELNTGIASVQTNEGKSEEWGIMSAFFRANYAFKQQLSVRSKCIVTTVLPVFLPNLVGVYSLLSLWDGV